MVDPKKYYTRHIDKQDAIDMTRVPLERKAHSEAIRPTIPPPPGNPTIRYYVGYIEECECVSIGTTDDGQPCLVPARCKAKIYLLDISKNVTNLTVDPYGGHLVNRDEESPVTCLVNLLAREDEPAELYVYNKSHRRFCKTFVALTQDLSGHFWIDEPQETIVLTALVNIPCGQVGLCEDECGVQHLACNKSCRTLFQGLSAVAYYHCSSCPEETPFVFFHVEGPTKARAIAADDSCGLAGTFPITDFTPLDCCCLEYTFPTTAVNYGFCFRSGDILYLTWNDCEAAWEVTSVAPQSRVRTLRARFLDENGEEIPDADLIDPDCDDLRGLILDVVEVCSPWCEPLGPQLELKGIKETRLRKAEPEESGGPSCNLEKQEFEHWILRMKGMEDCPVQDVVCDSGDDSGCEWEQLLTTAEVEILTDIQLVGLCFVGTARMATVICLEDPYTVELFCGVECPPNESA